MMSRLRLYWHTLRHLRPVQVAARVRLHLPRPGPDLAPAPPVRAPAGAWCAPVPKPPSLAGADRLCLLNETHALTDMDGWDDPAISKLWRYNLHYLDFLGAAQGKAGERERLALLERWVAENPPAVGTGWEPYPTSLRIVNLVKLGLGGTVLPAPVAHSLAVQARWLVRRLEYHLLGNHLFVNAKALVFAGVYFDGPEAAAWLRTGLDILDAELKEQVLADGGHFELSPMYHALALEDMLDLVNAGAAAGAVLAAPVGRWRARCGPMATWLRAMSHADGQPGLFNDAASGIAPSPAALQAYAGRLGCDGGSAAADGITHLCATGFIRLQQGPAMALLDVGHVGPSYLPGHAHADTLSFEFSLGDQRLLVNSGTSEYGLGPERQRQRATPAHNTVAIDGHDSSEVWSGFRVARRARPCGLRLEAGATLQVECAHDGYRRLQGNNLHTRCWRLAPGRLVIEDRIDGRFGQAQAWLHLHPGVQVVRSDSMGCTLCLADGREVQLAVTGADVALEASTWHPAFGVSLPSRRLALHLTGPTLTTTLRWTP